MSQYKYSFKNLKENMARAVARDASVSYKVSIEATRYLKGKTTAQAKAILEKVLEKKLAIPYKKFTDGVGHRQGNGITSGRYPQKLSVVLITLLSSVEANASIKGLGDTLKIIHFSAQKASTPMHQGRQSRRVMKRTHIELVVEEVEVKKAISKNSKKTTKKKVETKNVEEKPKVSEKIEKVEVKKEEKKSEPVQEKKKEDVKPEQKYNNPKDQIDEKAQDKKEEPKLEETKK